MFANGPETICVEFSEVLTYGDQKLYMFQTLGNKIKIPRSLINKCQLIFGGPELTLEKKVVKFIVNFEDRGKGREISDLVINDMYKEKMDCSKHIYWGHKYSCMRTDIKLFKAKKF